MENKHADLVVDLHIVEKLLCLDRHSRAHRNTLGGVRQVKPASWCLVGMVAFHDVQHCLQFWLQVLLDVGHVGSLDFIDQGRQVQISRRLHSHHPITELPRISVFGSGHLLINRLSAPLRA